MKQASSHLKLPAKQEAVKAALRAGGVLLTVCRFLLIAGLCFIFLYPLIYMLSVAFRPTAEMLDPAVIWVSKSMTGENVRLAAELMTYPAALRNTVLIHLVSSLLQVAVCAITGYSFARFTYRGQKLLFGIVILSIMFPPQLTIIPLSRGMANFEFFGVGRLLSLAGIDAAVNLLDTPYPFYILAALGAGIKSGLFIFIFRQFFRNLPKELEEASAIDGCGFLGTFLRVILPNAIPVCISSVILSVVWYWNDYYFSSLFVPNYPTVSLTLAGLLNKYAGTFNLSYDPFEIVPLMQAGVMLTIAPVLLMYIILQRKLVQGMERSGLVG